MVLHFGEIRFRRQLGSGGFGDSFAAVFGGEVVAAKMLSDASFNTITREEFIEKSQLLFSLSHPNIVRYVCGNLSLRYKCLAMEYSEMSLFEAVHVRQMQMNDATKLDVMMQLWLGAWYLHRNNVAHVDIKATNVFLDGVSRYEAGKSKGMVAKLGDFGLAMMQKRPKFSTYLVRTVAARYSAPEIIGRKKLTLEELKMADVYSLATVCYEILTEHEPFSPLKSDEEVLRRRSHGSRPSDYGAGWLKESDKPSWHRSYSSYSRHPFLEDCWESQADKRPSARDMVAVVCDRLRTGARMD